MRPYRACYYPDRFSYGAELAIAVPESGRPVVVAQDQSDQRQAALAVTDC